jgi:hypothetical protein
MFVEGCLGQRAGTEVLLSPSHRISPVCASQRFSLAWGGGAAGEDVLEHVDGDCRTLQRVSLTAMSESSVKWLPTKRHNACRASWDHNTRRR